MCSLNKHIEWTESMDNCTQLYYSTCQLNGRKTQDVVAHLSFPLNWDTVLCLLVAKTSGGTEDLFFFSDKIPSTLFIPIPFIVYRIFDSFSCFSPFFFLSFGVFGVFFFFFFFPSLSLFFSFFLFTLSIHLSLTLTHTHTLRTLLHTTSHNCLNNPIFPFLKSITLRAKPIQTLFITDISATHPSHTYVLAFFLFLST